MKRATVPTSPEPMQRCGGCNEEWDRLRLAPGALGLLLCPRCRGMRWPEDFIEEGDK